jgi:hypothetical protein
MFDVSTCRDSIKCFIHLIILIELECGGLNQYPGQSMLTNTHFILKLESTM